MCKWLTVLGTFDQLEEFAETFESSTTADVLCVEWILWLDQSLQVAWCQGAIIIYGLVSWSQLPTTWRHQLLLSLFGRLPRTSRLARRLSLKVFAYWLAIRLQRGLSVLLDSCVMTMRMLCQPLRFLVLTNSRLQSPWPGSILATVHALQIVPSSYCLQAFLPILVFILRLQHLHKCLGLLTERNS